MVDGAKAGDADALRVLDILGQRLGIGIANAINLFDPQEIVIGGGVSTAGDLLLEPASAWPEYTVPGPRAPHHDPARAPRRAGRRARRGDGRGPRGRGEVAAMATARELETDYLPIAEHGLVGDLHTIALVGTNGTIDWYCCPSFDAPSVFGAILDKEKGGFYSLRPTAEDWDAKQLYFPETNVLITRFFTEDGVGEVQDYMPIDDAEITRTATG